jgi:ankyrin repeat protein
MTKLHDAIQKGDLRRVEILLQNQKTKVDGLDMKKMTPLHAASTIGRVDIVQLLLESNASISAAERSGMTALHFASQSGHADVVLSLIQANASTSAIVRGERKTALHLAAENGHYEVVEILARSKANVNAKSEGGVTPLFLASSQVTDSSLRVLKALVLAEANPNLPIDDMMTPLHKACELGAMRTIQALVDARADVSATASGETPLHIVAKRGRTDAARILVAAGADVAAKTDGGLTAVDLAQRAGADECRRILAAADAASRVAAPATCHCVDRRVEGDSDQVRTLPFTTTL